MEFENMTTSLPYQDKTDAFTRLSSHEVSQDRDMDDEGSGSEQDPPPRHFIVSIDYGTTFSCVSYIALRDPSPKSLVDPDQIDCIDEYTDTLPWDSYESKKEVPTESWYPRRLNRNKIIAPESTDGAASLITDDASGTSQSDSPTEEGALDSSVIDHGFDPMDEGPDDDDAKEFYWGYGVQKQLQNPDSRCDPDLRVIRPKLMLDTSEHTADIREGLGETFERLKSLKLIRQDTDVIADFLQRLLQQTRERFVNTYRFDNTSSVEFVLCVPVTWERKACRAMQAAMIMAIENSGFTNLASGSIENLFIISEPEAAAAYVLAGNNDINPGDTFILLDAGGGTVDAITYTVRRSAPLRLKTEAVKPAGALCGSSYLNEKYRKHLLERLEDEHYLEKKGKTIRTIVETKVAEFENLKRSINVNDKDQREKSIHIDGLSRNDEKRFKPGKLQFSRKDMIEIFKPCLDGVANLLRDQLSGAQRNNLPVKKILLIGGFAASRSLKGHLDRVVKKLNSLSPEARPMEIYSRIAPTTAVARGAILRAMRKDDGPARIIQSSYGFLRHEELNEDACLAHKGVKGQIDKEDGRTYVRKTIDWLIVKGTEVPPSGEYPITVTHTFPLNAKKFLCEERLYVSDDSHESHYKVTHDKNKGAEIAGTIISDMTYLKTEGRLIPEVPKKGESGRKHYILTFTLVMIVDGRNLRYEARYPTGAESRVQKKGQTNIAAAFVPGTR